jgi:hypothetical protein
MLPLGWKVFVVKSFCILVRSYAGERSSVAGVGSSAAGEFSSVWFIASSRSRLHSESPCSSLVPHLDHLEA